ncbi:glycoside hydrolase family 13 protein [Desemzia incerta]|uniref:glycoside hydrolase family 13 protein n=1 Tax=Desemzia TaxID=82800 RepID=UPI001E5F36CB|nr:MULTISPECIES: glycoside hydrolase family 13 protein [Desemzia]MCI3029980.1 glycoside hydrolase family 13 protein [Desemzia sp. C1]WHZ31876.1 glycoside hydrolase family 13 protein [Desemzia incerta]
MDTSALLHRPDSEYAYLYDDNKFNIRLRTKAGEAEKITLISGDNYAYKKDEWKENEQPLKLIAQTNIHDYWGIVASAPHNRLAYAFHITGKDGIEVLYSDRGAYPYEDRYMENINSFFRMPYFHDIDRVAIPNWARETIWYQIFPERFANGDKSNDPENVLEWGGKKHPSRDDFYGGDLQGVIDHLDYLVDLGINGIYFTPIFKAPSNHKYDTVDYFEVDPNFGDKQLFKNLVEEAHKRGIRVMLDAVFNHIGMSSYQWQDVLDKQEASEYIDWFHIDEFPIRSLEGLSADELENVGPLNYHTFAFTGHMPKLNTANPAVQKYLINIATYWVREFGIDAWRLDVANEVDHRFWKKFNRSVRKVNPDIYILGEIWHSSQSWLQGDEFHAVMNYAFTEQIEEFFTNKSSSAVKMVSGLNEQLMLYRRQTNEVMFNMLDSHDTPRLLTKANGNKQIAKAELTFMFAQTGSPCLFYGTEVGLEGYNDPDCRKCMIWDEEERDNDMYHFIRSLITFRKEHQDLLSFGETEWLDVREDERVIGFRKFYKGTEIYGYFNQGEETVSLKYHQEPVPIFRNLTSIKANEIRIKQYGFVLFTLGDEVKLDHDKYNYQEH